MNSHKFLGSIFWLVGPGACSANSGDVQAAPGLPTHDAPAAHGSGTLEPPAPPAATGPLPVEASPEPARAGTGNRRPHEVTQSSGLQLLPADQQPSALGKVELAADTAKGVRTLRANGMPTHKVGAFPNRGNPHAIEAQSYEVQVPAHPKIAGAPTMLGNHNFGFALNGVPFDPGAAEFYLGDRNSGWQYEALAGAVALGIDANHAHVQPTGAYHYHGLPHGLLDELGVAEGKVGPQIGWAADGFPIYALYGPSDPQDSASAPVAYRSSWKLRQGARPSGEGHPGGNYDGTFTADYQFVPGQGELDMCNGREVVTAEFPEGTYAYFLSAQWPVIPRCYRGSPDASVTARAPGGPPGGPPGGGRRPGGRRGGR